MPRKPLRAIRLNADYALTPDQIMHLLHGWCLDDATHPYYKLHGDLQFPFRDDEHRKELYFKNHDYILSLSGKDVDGVFAGLEAGKKPKAFYDYEG